MFTFNVLLIIYQVIFAFFAIEPLHDGFNNLEKPSPKFVVNKLDNGSGKSITDFLPGGYVKDGSVDYTEYIQLGIDRNDKLIFPGFPILINDSGLKIGSNKTLIFLKGSELRLKPSAKTHYAVLDIKGVQNVNIHNVVIKGDRFSHLGSSGEWGMGIRINGSRNINVFGASVTECWGDGIYIGQNKGVTSKDIVIKDARLLKNRRDGISIISVDGLILENTYAAYQDGTLPMCGINFETNNSDCEIKNVKVINPKTEFNKGSGIQIGLSTMLGGSDKQIDVTIINHMDLGSKSFALKVACKRKPEKNRGNVNGSITVIKPMWNGTIGNRPLAFVTDQPNLNLTITSPRVRNTTGRVLNSAETRSILNKHSNGKLKIL